MIDSTNQKNEKNFTKQYNIIHIIYASLLIILLILAPLGNLLTHAFLKSYLGKLDSSSLFLTVVSNIDIIYIMLPITSIIIMLVFYLCVPYFILCISYERLTLEYHTRKLAIFQHFSNATIIPAFFLFSFIPDNIFVGLIPLFIIAYFLIQLELYNLLNSYIQNKFLYFLNSFFVILLSLLIIPFTLLFKDSLWLYLFHTFLIILFSFFITHLLLGKEEWKVKVPLTLLAIMCLFILMIEGTFLISPSNNFDEKIINYFNIKDGKYKPYIINSNFLEKNHLYDGNKDTSKKTDYVILCSLRKLNIGDVHIFNIKFENKHFENIQIPIKYIEPYIGKDFSCNKD